MSTLTLDQTVTTRSALAALLPEDVRDRIDEDLLRDTHTAAALRVLATIRNEAWHNAVEVVRIDWRQLNAWITPMRENDSVRIRVIAAASLAGFAGTCADLYRIGVYLDADNRSAIADGMRILAEGLQP